MKSRDNYYNSNNNSKILYYNIIYEILKYDFKTVKHRISNIGSTDPG